MSKGGGGGREQRFRSQMGNPWGGGGPPGGAPGVGLGGGRIVIHDGFVSPNLIAKPSAKFGSTDSDPQPGRI